MTQALPLSRLAVHTITTKPLPLPVALEEYARAGIGGVTLWRDAVEAVGVHEAARLVRASGLKPVALCRGGFFVAMEAAARAAAIDDNRKILAEAAALGCPMVVLVCGAARGVPLDEGRKQIRGAIEALLPEAERTGVKLAIEPLHPMYADSRSAVVSLTQANDMVEAIGSKHVVVALDVYHTWWDDRLPSEITRCAKLNALAAFHVCDYRSPTRDLLNDRGLPGDGVIPVRHIRQMVEAAGFTGHIEVEVFSTELWQTNQNTLIDKIVRSYHDHV
jgi:sugar phosphate isomerase/epimerase